jgi:hypothetical protein
MLNHYQQSYLYLTGKLDALEEYFTIFNDGPHTGELASEVYDMLKDDVKSVNEELAELKSLKRHG